MIVSVTLPKKLPPTSLITSAIPIGSEMDCRKADVCALESATPISSEMDSVIPVLPRAANEDWAKAAYPNIYYAVTATHARASSFQVYGPPSVGTGVGACHKQVSSFNCHDGNGLGAINASR